MTKDELRKEVDEITRIFISAKYYALDFSYLHSVRYTAHSVYNTFHFIIDRLFHSVCVSLVLDLSKLFDKREKYSIEKLVNKMRYRYSNSEL